MQLQCERAEKTDEYAEALAPERLQRVLEGRLLLLASTESCSTTLVSGRNAHMTLDKRRERARETQHAASKAALLIPFCSLAVEAVLRNFRPH